MRTATRTITRALAISLGAVAITYVIAPPAIVGVLDLITQPVTKALEGATMTGVDTVDGPAAPVGDAVRQTPAPVTGTIGQALAFTPIDVRVRDAAGIEYRGGAAIGPEPMINPRNLNPGERSRGWVWYVLPQATEPAEVVYIAPQPQFRVSLGG